MSTRRGPDEGPEGASAQLGAQCAGPSTASPGCSLAEPGGRISTVYRSAGVFESSAETRGPARPRSNSAAVRTAGSTTLNCGITLTLIPITPRDCAPIDCAGSSAALVARARPAPAKRKPAEYLIIGNPQLTSQLLAPRSEASLAVTPVSEQTRARTVPRILPMPANGRRRFPISHSNAVLPWGELRDRFNSGLTPKPGGS